jgi:hypothetical protein
MPEQPTEDEEMPLDDEDDLPLALATLFHNDIEDSDFDDVIIHPAFFIVVHYNTRCQFSF